MDMPSHRPALRQPTSEVHLHNAMQDVGDKAKDAANQTEGAIKDAAGAVKDKVSEQIPCRHMCGMLGLPLSTCCPVRNEAVCRKCCTRTACARTLSYQVDAFYTHTHP